MNRWHGFTSPQSKKWRHLDRSLCELRKRSGRAAQISNSDMMYLLVKRKITRQQSLLHHLFVCEW